MQKKTPSTAYLLRRIQGYKKRYEDAVELRRQQATQIKKYRDQLSGVLEGQVRTARMATEHLVLARDDLARARDTLASNAMTIRELEDQVAVQYKLAAEARSDVERASKLAMEAAAKHNRMVQQIQQLYDTVREYRDLTSEMQLKLDEARLTLRYRAYLWMMAQFDKVWT